jgi:tRNA(Ile)-lysidine synthase
MPESLSQRIVDSVRRHRMFAPGAVAGVAVSGGADSVALLLLFEELKATLGVRLLVVHFNHQLRGEESDCDEKFVRSLAEARGLEFIAGSEDVAGRARENGWNLEDAGRRLRYQFFAGLVQEGRAMRIAVAHTADDQAETVLAQMVRGTGPAGLAGIYPVTEAVVRPLLQVRRDELRAFLAGRRQTWREDSTNGDVSRLRARIRSRLTPLLEKDFQPAIVGHLGQLAGLAREDESFWQGFIEEGFRTLVRREAGRFTISSSDLLRPRVTFTGAGREAQAAVSKRLVRRILQELRGSRQGFSSRHVEDVIGLAEASASGHQVQLPGGLVVEKVFSEIIFAHKSRADGAADLAEVRSSCGGFSYELPLNGASDLSIDIAETGKRLRLKVIDWSLRQRDTIRYALDRELLRAPLEVRNWRPGDAYRPQGRLHHGKLKHLLCERRIALGERACWPVLTSAGTLVWTRGFPFAAEFAAGAKTRTGVLVIEEPL